MKLLLIMCLAMSVCMRVNAQQQELAQLSLNLEKLAELKKILQNMYETYRILQKGYNTIKGIAEGNFNLHDAFLKRLLEVNPLVKSYYKITGIINNQRHLVAQYRRARSTLGNDKNFTSSEVGKILRVYERLIDQSLKNLDELLLVITAAKLRMSDEERLSAIDRIANDMERKLGFSSVLSESNKMLSAYRAKEKHDGWIMGRLHQLK